MFGKVKATINLLQTSNQPSSAWNFEFNFAKAKSEEVEKVSRLVRMI